MPRSPTWWFRPTAGGWPMWRSRCCANWPRGAAALTYTDGQALRPSQSFPQRRHVETLNVDLGARSYPILIGAGLLDRAELWGQQLAARELLLVSNTTVAPLYMPRLAASLGGRRSVEVILPDGELHKTLGNAARILDVLIANRFAR